MNREANPQEWLRYAGVDRQAAKHLLDAGDYETCAFHCQQAVEKLLKAIIVKQTGEPPPYAHDLLTLLKKISGIEVEESMAESINAVDSYYIGTRYPLDVVDPGTFKKPLAEKAVQQTEEIFTWFLTRITFDGT